MILIAYTFLVLTLPLWFVPLVLYFVSHFVSLVFIHLIIFRVEIKKHLAFSQLSTLRHARVVDREFSDLRCFMKPLVVSLWFCGLLTSPELHCDWSPHSQHSWKFLAVHSFLSLTINRLLFSEDKNTSQLRDEYLVVFSSLLR